MGTTKTCTKCKRMLPLEDFSRRSKHADVRRSRCKECSKIDIAAYRATNRDKLSDDYRRYYASNKEECTAYQRRYYAANKEKCDAASKRYSKAHKEEIAAKAKAYRKDNPEYIAARDKKTYLANREKRTASSRKYRDGHKEECAARNLQWWQDNPDKARAFNAKRRALKKGATTEPLPDNYDRGLYEAQRGLCFYCGEILEETGQHLEHMTPLSRGGSHSLANLCLSCPTCNLKKGTKTAEEFVAYEAVAL